MSDRRQAHDADYAALLTLFVRLVESQARTKIEPGQSWLNDAQTLSIKLFRHLVSMQSLAAGATLHGAGLPDVTFIDHASIQVVARAAFETYLVFFYLYGDLDHALCEFRHKTWVLGGLADRQKSHASTEENRKQLADEKKRIETLRAEIEPSPYFQAYTGKRRQRLLEGDWRVGISWADLGKNAGFHDTYFRNVYGYLCGYSHSSYISVLQVGQAPTLVHQRMLSGFSIDVGIVLLSHFAFTYANLFDAAKMTLAADPTAMRLADKWRIDRDRMAAIYDKPSQPVGDASGHAR